LRIEDLGFRLGVKEEKKRGGKKKKRKKPAELSSLLPERLLPTWARI